MARIGVMVLHDPRHLSNPKVAGFTGHQCIAQPLQLMRIIQSAGRFQLGRGVVD